MQNPVHGTFCYYATDALKASPFDSFLFCYRVKNIIREFSVTSILFERSFINTNVEQYCSRRQSSTARKHMHLRA